MGKWRKWDISSLILAVVGIGLIAAALIVLGRTILDYKKSGDTYDALNRDYVAVVLPAPEETESSNWWYEDVTIDFAGLLQENPEIVAWIRFDNIEILSYPILYSGDDEKYLRTDIYGNDSTAGCIFLEAACTPDFNDCHTILYGHNMKNLSMFGSLKKYKTEDIYEDNQYFTIYTGNMAYRYQIFAYRDVAETDQVFTVGFEPDEKFEEFIDDIMRHSYESTGVTVTKNDKIVTLSTCSTQGKRFVVHGVRVDEHTYDGGE